MARQHAFGAKSQSKLATCHPVMVAVTERALMRSPVDFTIIHGWRGKDLQNVLVDSGASRTRWPDSKHNKTLDPDIDNPLQFSDAVDFGPWIMGKVPWDDTHIFAAVAGCFFAAADELDARIRWGGDWDGDGSTKNQTLMDWGHIELVFAT